MSTERRFTILLLSLLLLLFYFLLSALVTQHFLYPNLSLLAHHLHISPKIAGLTLLALGNATPDIFSTYSAMSHHSASLALGELVGAANFVICVVVGGMGLVRPFEADNMRFVWDLITFTALVGAAFIFISDGKLWNIECLLMISGYVGYVGYQIMYKNDVVVGIDEDGTRSVMEEGLLHAEEHNDSRSINSLDQNQLKGIQPVSILEAQRIWRSKEVENDEGGSLLTRPSLDRAYNSTEHVQLRQDRNDHEHFKSKSSDQINNITHIPPLPLPQIVIDSIIDEESSEPTDTTTEQSVITKDGPWWRYLLSPLTDNEPKTLLTYLTSPIIVCLNFLCPVLPIQLYKNQDVHAKEFRFKHCLFLFQILTLPTLFICTLVTKPSPIQILAITMILLLLNYITPHTITIPVFGFISSILVIILSSSHLILLLKNLGVILRMPESLLGLTILALGNSTGDLVSNLTLAGLDMGIVGLHACLGAPLLYILFGIGVNGLVINMMKGRQWMELDMDINFKISSVGLIFMLAFYAIAVPWRGWMIDRTIGAAAIFWWCLVTTVNVWVSM
ncbi:CYFA0S25e00496g1_1 [Cyberlindnera fabianii]|uniref:CYFA0S25e00496g1_1 n=1 Tax=Cyberlindnera fabianii TaxID=36022 RepID=A0A061B9Q1_CYBFA|nr:CYFA0S25e00496g1_1 [Cyberlindnera fabianii]